MWITTFNNMPDIILRQIKTHEHMSKVLAALLNMHARLYLLAFDAYSPMNRLVKNLTKTAEGKREKMIS